MLKNIENVTWYSPFWHAISLQYATIMSWNRDLVIIWSIDSKLIGSNIYEKKTWQTATIYKDDFTFSVFYNWLKVKGKAYVFENIFKIP